MGAHTTKMLENPTPPAIIELTFAGFYQRKSPPIQVKSVSRRALIRIFSRELLLEVFPTRGAEKSVERMPVYAQGSAFGHASPRLSSKVSCHTNCHPFSRPPEGGWSRFRNRYNPQKRLFMTLRILAGNLVVDYRSEKTKEEFDEPTRANQHRNETRTPPASIRPISIGPIKPKDVPESWMEAYSEWTAS